MVKVRVKINNTINMPRAVKNRAQRDYVDVEKLVN